MNKKDVFVNHYEYSGVEGILSEVHGKDFLEYRKNFNNISDNLLESDKPMYIVLAINSYCNLRCTMCLRNFVNSRESKIDMPMETIESICSQCKEFGIPSLFLGATSEALLRKDIVDVLKTVKKSGTIDNFLITNGTMLTEQLSNVLVELQYERIYISIDAAKKETYRKIRGGNIENVEMNIQKLLEIKEKKKSKLPIIRVSFVKQKENEAELEEFVKKWKNKIDIIDIQNMIDYSNINNLKEVYELEEIEFNCPSPFRMLYIDYLGDIFPCSSDYCTSMKIGNIKDMTIKEAWNSKLMCELRNSIKSGQLGKICKNCAHNVSGGI